jgi:hypothetical protein
MLKIIRFDWNNVWTFEQIKWVENHYETLSRVIKKWKHEINDISNLDDTTTYSFESIVESNRYIRHVIFDDRHIKFSTSDDQHEMYSTLSAQSSYAYSVIRAQLEYSLGWPQGWVSDMSDSPTRFNPRVGQKFLFDGSSRVLAIVRRSNPTREIVRNLRLDKIR